MKPRLPDPVTFAELSSWLASLPEYPDADAALYSLWRAFLEGKFERVTHPAAGPIGLCDILPALVVAYSEKGIVREINAGWVHPDPEKIAMAIDSDSLAQLPLSDFGQRFREAMIEPLEITHHVYAKGCQRAGSAVPFFIHAPSVRYTIQDITDCEKWLEAQMRADRKTGPKRVYKNKAKSRFGVGVRAFNKAWDNAVQNTRDPHGWAQPGRLKK